MGSGRCAPMGAWLGIVGLFMTMGAQAGTVLQDDFEELPYARGWTYEKGSPQEEPWSGDFAAAGSHSLKAAGGQWFSPPFLVKPFQWYRVSFQTRAAKPGLWAALFQDRENAELPDHYSQFDAGDSWVRHEFCFRAKALARSCRIMLTAAENGVAYFDAFEVRTAERSDVAAWSDAVYATVPPLRVTSPADRWSLLPNTKRMLDEAKLLRVVMLGDSIINDTGSSPWELLVEREWEDARIEVVTSVRGGTGCWWYREENRVKSYVLDHKPDLVIVGGISQKGDLAAIQAVIDQVRAARPQQEILLMTGPVGFYGDPRRPPPEPKPGVMPSPEYIQKLAALAAEQGCGFYDMETLWKTYIGSSEKPYEYFLRDPVHANDRGRAVLARLMESFFKS